MFQAAVTAEQYMTHESETNMLNVSCSSQFLFTKLISKVEKSPSNEDELWKLVVSHLSCFNMPAQFKTS